MARGFCSADTATKKCPTCGADLTYADYYTAMQGASTILGQKQETNWAQGKTTVTTKTSTQYSDIRQHTGAICMHCCYKRLYTSLLLARIMVIFGVASIAFAAIQLLILETNEIWAIISGVLGLSLVFVGWHLMGNNGLFARNPYKVQKGITPVPTSSITYNDANHNHVSSFIARDFPYDKIPQGKVILSRGEVKRMK